MPARCAPVHPNPTLHASLQGSSDTTGRLVTSLRKLGFDYV